MFMPPLSSEEPGPGPVQIYICDSGQKAPGSSKVRPDIAIEFQRCPVHKSFAGNEKVYEWDKLAEESLGPTEWNSGV